MAGPIKNRTAFERTVEALRAGGRIEPVDAAVIVAGRTLARIIDARDEPVVHAMWPYLKVIEILRGAPSSVDDRELADILKVLQAPVGDAPIA